MRKFPYFYVCLPICILAASALGQNQIERSGQSASDPSVSDQMARKGRIENLSDEALFLEYVETLRKDSLFRTASMVCEHDLIERGIERFLPMLPSLFNDSSADVITSAYALYGWYSARSQNPATRALAADILTDSLVSWLRSMEPPESKCESLICVREAMSQFICSRDFSGTAKTNMERALSLCMDENKACAGTLVFLIRACGVAGMDSAKPYLARAIEQDKQEKGEPDLARLLSGYNWKGSLTWAAMRASARIYESQDIYACIATVKGHSSTPEQLLDNARELTYIRRPEIAEFLLPLTADETPYQDLGGDVLQYFHSRADQAAQTILQMMPDVFAEAQAEIGAKVAANGNSALPPKEQTAIYVKYATDKNNWKYIER